MRQRIFWACAALVGGMAYGGVSITADTTVTDADVASYVGQDIDIAAGATLCFQNLSAPQTFTGRLTGGGRFVVKSAAENVAARIGFSGDATGLAGGIYVTNHLVDVAGPAALGSSGFTLKMQANGQLSYLNGTGAYTCPMDVIVCDTHPKGLVVGKDAEIAGALTWRGGRICGPGRVTGPMKVTGHCYGQADIHFAGGLEGGSLYSDSGEFHLDAPATKLASLSVTGGTAHFGCENAVPETTPFGIGAVYNPSGRYNLHGHDQRCQSLSLGATKTERQADTWFGSMDGPAVLTVRNQGSNQNFHGNLKGGLSLDYSSAGGRRLLLCGKANDTTGGITVRSGTVAVDSTAVFTALAGIEATGSGTFEVVYANGKNPVVPSKKLTLTLAEEGKVKIPAGTGFEVNAAVVDGVELAAGRYTKDSEGVGAHIVGDGYLAVLAIEEKAEGATFTWKGGTADESVRAAANWVGGAAPSFDGTERLVFGPEGTQSAVVDGTIAAYAIDITGNAAFRLDESGAGAKILLGAGGLTTTNRVDDAKVTHELRCPVELAAVPQTWTIGGDTEFINRRPIGGPERVVPETFTLRCFGRFFFDADNSQLHPKLVVSNLCGSASHPHIYRAEGLGSPARETTFIDCMPYFITASRAMTNNVPLRLRNDVTNQEHGYVNNSGQNPLYIDAPVTYVDINGEVYSRGKVHFRGGVFRSDGAKTVFRTPGGDNWLEGDVGIQTPGPFHIDYPGVFHIAAPCSWSEFNPYKCVVQLHAANVLAPGKPVKLSNSGVYHSNAAALDLNGFDQSVGRLTAGYQPKDYPNDPVTLKSETPAVLEVATAASNNDVVPLRVQGAAGFRFAAPGSFAFTNFLCTTTGSLDVQQGTVKICAGAGWTATTNVVVGAAGVLEVGPGAGATAFGPQQGRSAADVTLVPGGTFTIAAGETATVHAVTIHDPETGKDRFVTPGLYGAADTTAKGAHGVDWIQGAGLLNVAASFEKGTIFLVR